MKYEKPDLEELELLLEGSFLNANSEDNFGVGDGGDFEDGDEWD